MSDVVVVPHGKEWAVRVNNAEEVEVFNSRIDALDYAHEQARNIHGYVMLQNNQGRLMQEASYRPLGVPDEETDIALDS